MLQDEVYAVLRDHRLWLLTRSEGKRADLKGADLSGFKLAGVDLREADMEEAYLVKADLQRATLTGAELRGANLSNADLTDANLDEAGLHNAILLGARLSVASLYHTNLAGAHLCMATAGKADFTKASLVEANLRGAVLRGANFSGATLNNCNLCDADLSGAEGLPSQSSFIEQLEDVEDGVIVYKTFGRFFPPRRKWKIEPLSILEEICNHNRTDQCGCGINVGTKVWTAFAAKCEIWQCLIRWEWLADVCVPYGTDGKFRCGKLQLLKIVT